LREIPGGHQEVLPYLKKLGVEVMFNTPYTDGDKQGFESVLDCRGYKYTGPRKFMAEELRDCISQSGELQVNRYCQLANDPEGEWSSLNIFSFGDIARLTPHVNYDGKSIVQMYQYVRAVATNIRSSLFKKEKPQKITKEFMLMQIVPIGAEMGLFQMNKVVKFEAKHA